MASVPIRPAVAGDRRASVVSLAQLEDAIRASWSIETCDPVDRGDWTTDLACRGQCGVTALVVQDWVGGELLEAVVLHLDGTHQGYHYWNRLAGVDVDLTRAQFTRGEVIQESTVVERLE